MMGVVAGGSLSLVFRRFSKCRPFLLAIETLASPMVITMDLNAPDYMLALDIVCLEKM